MTTEKNEELTPPLTHEPLQKTVKLTEHWSPVAQVAEACDLPRADIITAAEKGAVWWQKANGAEKYRKPVRVRSLDSKVSAGDLILINYNKQVLEEVSAVPVLVSDQGNYSVWNKPAGMLSQGTKWSDHCSITCAVEKIHLKKSFLVHRLDRAASGLIVIAHTKNALVALTDMFAKRLMEKTYEAIVQGEFNVVLPQVIDVPIEGKEAHTEILSAIVQGGASDDSAGSKETTESQETCLIVKIKTGRKHQIRSHLATLGHPVVGDRLFDKDRTHTVDLKLTSIGLSFVCPFSGIKQNISLHSE